MIPDFCPRCGKKTKTLLPDPEFCGGCGLLLVALDDAEPEDVQVAPDLEYFDPYPDLQAGDGWALAFEKMLVRHFEIQAPLNVGVIIQMGVPVQAAPPMHHRNFDSKLADPSQRPLPYNLAVNPHAPSPELWIDARNNQVSRAGAIVYYWGGASDKWHFEEGLDSRVDDRIVTVTPEDTIDFELRFKADMYEPNAKTGVINYDRVMTEAFAALERYLLTGVNTKGRRIEPVGQPTGWAIFAMAELDPKYRRPE